MPVDRRLLALGLVAAVAIAGLVATGPIAQDPGYYRFADDRTLLGVPNFWNVASNLPFLILGLVGAARIVRRSPPGLLPALRPVWLTFFGGASLVAFGSGWFHVAPSDSSLGWDRAPMTIAFMAFFAAVVGEQIDVGLGRRLAPLLVAVGLFSVIWWRLGGHGGDGGDGDLRLYIAVQFVPLLLLPLLLLLYRPPLVPVGWVWGVLGWYLVAKLFEIADRPLLAATGLSGHTWKHLAAAAGVATVSAALERRRPPVAALR